MSTIIRILVCDDHPIVREGLVAILSTQEDFEVVGEADSGKDMLEKAQELKPDILLLDLEMPEMDGAEALRQLKDSFPDIQAIIFTAYDTDERILGALQAGAKGYLLKGAPRAEIFQAIRIVSQGGSLLQPVVASRLLQHFAHQGTASNLADLLTDREMEVLNLLAQGATNREISERLVISERTAKFHVSSILGKLGVSNRTEAVTTAAQMGLIEL